MKILLLRFLSKLIPIYGIKESNFVGNVVFRINDFEDKPHINAIFTDGAYVKYSDIFLSSKAAEAGLKKKNEETFLKETESFPKENIELAEKLERMGLIDPVGFNDIMQHGVNSKTYKDLYESQQSNS